MAVFYIFPARPAIGEWLAGVLGRCLPGLPLRPEDCVEILPALLREYEGEAILLFREDFPDGPTLMESLRDGFGAEPDDAIVEIRLPVRGDEPQIVRHNSAAHSFSAKAERLAAPFLY